MGGACRTHEGGEECTQGFSRKTRRKRDESEDIDVGEGIILK
jgi:hypothetical protein